MCGIAGYAGPDPVPRERIERCLGAMRHRGPDSAAHRHFQLAGGRAVELLFTRLSIIDLDPRANQPFHLGRKWITTNGELYNYLEVRAALERRGRQFATDSDTEVLLAAIDELGWAGLDGCEGMWAFAVLDEAEGRLTLGRDRFGEKPLYLYRDGGGIYWGSEQKFVAELLGRPLEVDLDQVRRYLVNGYKALYKRGQTFFRGLTELPRASLLHLDGGGNERSERYWQPVLRPREQVPYEEAVAGVRERLLRSLELRLRADVPLAFCMSGGVDSLSLISAAKRVFDYDVHGFTIVNTDERYEEQELVDHAVAELGITHTALPLRTEGFLERLRGLVRHHDAPLYTITYYAHWLLMESIAERGYRISVSGTAADELFTGYYDHHLAYLAAVRDDPALYKRALRGWERNVHPLVRNPFLRDPDLFVRDPGFRGHVYLNADEFAGYLRDGFDEPFEEEGLHPELLRNRMLNELFHEAVPVILHEDDLNAMYFSLENRSPFLDRPLFEFAAEIPTRQLVREGVAKVVLRDAMRGIVPDKVLDNPRKVGFNAPILAFLDHRDALVRDELLRDSPIFEHVRRDRIEQLLERGWLPNSESKFLFYFLNSKLFLEEFAA